MIDRVSRRGLEVRGAGPAARGPRGMARGGIGRFAGAALVLLLALATPADGQPVASGAAYLAAEQQAAGDWDSRQVRFQQATTESLRALGEAGLAAPSRSAAADFLASGEAADNDDLARRIAALAGEGREVGELVDRLVGEAAFEGGWGLTGAFAPDLLDTALAVEALAGFRDPNDEVLRRGLAFLLAAQREDGGFPCVLSPDAESHVFCTSQALLALVRFRSAFFLEEEIDAAVAFLRGRLNADGSFGPPGPEILVSTALAARALAAVPAFGGEVAGVESFLAASQAADGSWQGDPYPTALALRALVALSGVVYCGDGQVNQPAESCDGLDLAGATCEALGLGPGTLGCSAQCTFDTAGCSAAPVCGDDLRNQSFEVCDGSDLAAESCESLGFASGTLDCADDCTRFDFGGCNAEASCGDGVVNQPGELCDLNDLNGLTCESLGLGAGLLQCAADCNLDTALCAASGFEIDHKGREFFVGFLRNFDSTGTAALHLAADVETTATVQYPAVSPTFVQTVPVRPGEVAIVNLPRSTHTGWTAGAVLSNAVRVSAPEELVVYPVNRRSFSSDAGMALPVDALGTSYVVTTYVSSFLVSSDRSQFLVVAPFEATTVTITPTAALRVGSVTHPAGVPFVLPLDRGQGFRGEAAFLRTDLTGTRIQSDRPVFVMNGNVCANVPRSTAFCDHVFEVAHPVRSWGTSALMSNLPNRAGGSYYRVVADGDGTEVFLDGVLQAEVGRGGFLEIGPLAGSHEISASGPIFVTQFMSGSRSAGATLGDPAMANMVPADQYLESYTFSTVGGGQFSRHFVTVTVPEPALPQLMLDGAAVDPALFTPIGTTGFSSAVLPIAEGTHTTWSPEPHGITVEGINRDDSYVYPGGARLELINQFCGDGEANLEGEQCDGSDFRGATCATFGFSAGFLQCTVDCRVDTGRCSGIATVDEDGDGFPAGEDCDDRNPEIHPGREEIPGNGLDDDCNPATPDEVPEGALSCSLLSAKLLYSGADLMRFDGRIENGDATFSLTGLISRFVVEGSEDAAVYQEVRELAPLPPGGRSLQSYVLSALGRPAGTYRAVLTVEAAGTVQTRCEIEVAVEDDATTGAGLDGTLAMEPAVVDAGDPSDAVYSVVHRGNAPLVDLALRVLLLDPLTGAVVGEATETLTLDPGAGHQGRRTFPTVGLESNRTYVAALLARPDGAAEDRTLAEARLTVVNAPPDCTGAVAAPGLLWPPNHDHVPVEVNGVTDPDGDPVSVVVTAVFQDERTDDPGSGRTCPDASGTGTAQASVRAERSGRQDGRTYHLFFEASDGRGGACEGAVQVCVPHSRKGSCGDQGPLHDSTRCE